VRGSALCLGPLLGLSCVLAVLPLAVMLFAWALYDEVLPTRNSSALALLTALVLAALAVFVWLDSVRSRLLCEAGLALVAELDRAAIAALPTWDKRRLCAATVDLERLSRFASGPGPAAIFDALWLPGYVLAMGLIHPLLGLFAVLALLALAASARAGARITGQNAAAADGLFHDRLALVRRPRSFRHVRGQAQGRRASPGRDADACAFYGTKALAARRAGRLAAFAKGLRMMLQAAGLALGGLLVIHDAMSPGALVAVSILLTRAFAAMDAVGLHGRAISEARACYGRLQAYGARRAPRRDPLFREIIPIDSSMTQKCPLRHELRQKTNHQNVGVGP